MYIDLVIILAILLVVVIFFRRFSSFVYSVAIIDIFLRILTFVKYNTVDEIRNLIGNKFPESISALISKYCSGLLHTVVMWAYVIIFAIFLWYITSYFIKKKK